MFCSSMSAAAGICHPSSCEGTGCCTFNSGHSKKVGRTRCRAAPSRQGARPFATQYSTTRRSKLRWLKAPERQFLRAPPYRHRSAHFGPGEPSSASTKDHGRLQQMQRLAGRWAGGCPWSSIVFRCLAARVSPRRIRVAAFLRYAPDRLV